jgi:hypothetical protein
MSSEFQQTASRTNGAKSNGPITEEGKQASSQNRLAHGFNSKRVVLPGESQEEFDELLAGYLGEHQPATPTERTLIENMAIARWRQQRAWTLETAGLTTEMRRPRYIEGEDPETQAFVAFRTLTDDSRTLELLNRYEARFERQFRAALTALLNLQTKRRAEERENAKAEAATSPKTITYRWVDPDWAVPKPEPQPTPGSFGSPKSGPENPPVTDISGHQRRGPTALSNSHSRTGTDRTGPRRPEEQI